MLLFKSIVKNTLVCGQIQSSRCQPCGFLRVFKILLTNVRNWVREGKGEKTEYLSCLFWVNSMGGWALSISKSICTGDNSVLISLFHSAITVHKTELSMSSRWKAQKPHTFEACHKIKHFMWGWLHWGTECVFAQTWWKFVILYFLCSFKL